MKLKFTAQWETGIMKELEAGLVLIKTGIHKTSCGTQRSKQEGSGPAEASAIEAGNKASW